MRVALFSHFQGSAQEGLRLTAKRLAHQLQLTHDLLLVDIASPSTWSELRHFQPEIFHAILGPNTYISPLLAKLLSISSRNLVLSALQATVTPSRILRTRVVPETVLIQSPQSYRLFEAPGRLLRFVPNGVDTDEFRPLGPTDRSRVRASLGFDEDEFLALHIGPARDGRNAMVLADLARLGARPVLISRPEDVSPAIVGALEKKGCRVIARSIRSISRYISVSDLYVFPTTDLRHCIETPLSVLEAMSCNLPIVSTPYYGLPILFHGVEGLSFVEKPEHISAAVKRMMIEQVRVRTRDAVTPYSWSRVAETISDIYSHLLGESGNHNVS